MKLRQCVGRQLWVILTTMLLSPASASESSWNIALSPGLADSRAAAAVTQKDRQGLYRDTTYFVGYQFAAIAMLYSMPEDVTHWSDEQKDNYSLSIWWNNVRNPSWDSDDYAINYLAHPYWGAAYYVRARERGYSDAAGFWYSMLLSSLYEFGAEALFEKPSIQDLIVTPVAGTLVGRFFVHARQNARSRSAIRSHRSTGDKLLLALTDPLGVLNRGVDRLFRRHVSVDLRFFDQPVRAVPDTGTPDRSGSGEWVIYLGVRGNW